MFSKKTTKKKTRKYFSSFFLVVFLENISISAQKAQIKNIPLV